jgi:hypothetical protein
MSDRDKNLSDDVEVVKKSPNPDGPYRRKTSKPSVSPSHDAKGRSDPDKIEEDDRLNSNEKTKSVKFREDQDDGYADDERSLKARSLLSKPSTKRSSAIPYQSNEGLWTAFNKYVYSGLLIFMATFHFNLLGFLYFLLLIIHTLAFYAFRVSEQQIDYLLVRRRDRKIDIRQFFAYTFSFVSGLAMIGIFTMKIVIHVTG